MARPCRALINLDNLSANLALAQSLTKQGQCMAIVKAQAYGHGALAVAKHIEDQVEAFAVSSCEEAIELRDAGIQHPILLLEGVFDYEDLVRAVVHEFWIVVHNRFQLDLLATLTDDQKVSVFLKLDTGMHRLGCSASDFAVFLDKLEHMPQVIQPPVLMSHFACADDTSHAMNVSQLTMFKSITRGMKLPLSLSNSAALMSGLVDAEQWSRPGIMLYGGNPMSPQASSVKLLPVMHLVSEIIAVREVKTGESVGYGAAWVADKPSRIATVAAGYADGYPRLAKAGTPVWVDGKRCPLVGRVSMDMLTVDITDHKMADLNSPVELWGEYISVDEVAACANTISYDLLAAMPARVPRVYL